MDRSDQPRARRRVALGVVAIATLLIAGCAADDPLPVAVNATVGIEATGCSMVPDVGTGVAVVHRGTTVIVTSAHTVAGAETIRVHTGPSVFEAAVLAFDPDLDLAILDAPAGLVGRPLAIPSAQRPATVVVRRAAEPAMSFTTVVTRLLRVTIEDIYVEDRVTRRAFEFSGQLHPGDSGAPVFSLSGEVLGVVYARSRSRTVGFAVSAAEIIDLVDHTVDVLDPMDLPSVGRCL